MKVSELIKRLQKMDPNAVVVIRDHYGGVREIELVRKKTIALDTDQSGGYRSPCEIVEYKNEYEEFERVPGVYIE